MWNERLINIAVGIIVIAGVLWAGGRTQSRIQADLEASQKNIADLKAETTKNLDSINEEFGRRPFAQLQQLVISHCASQVEYETRQMRTDDQQTKETEMLHEGILRIEKAMSGVEAKLQMLIDQQNRRDGLENKPR